MTPQLLIVDDESSSLFGMTAYFQLIGIDVRGTADPIEARTWIDDGPCIGLITDLHLTPDHQAEGLELAAIARARHPELRVVLITAALTPEVEQRAAACGCIAVRPRPIAMGDLADLILGVESGRPEVTPS